MIKEASLWQGGYLSTYKTELDEWLESRRVGTEEIRRISLLDIDPKDPRWEDHELHDESVWFEPSKTLYIDNLELWKADQINPLMKMLAGLETIFTIAFVQRSMAKPLKSLSDLLTEEPRDHGISTDVDGLSEWIVEWLDSRDVKLQQSAARRLAEHCAEDVEQAVQVCQALSIGNHGQKATWADIEPQLGSLGEVPIFDLTKAIVAGDKEGAVIIARRIANTSHPLQPLKLISNKYRQYAAAVDSRLSVKDLATQLGVNEWALKYSSTEAKRLGKERVIKSYMMITEAERNMKGGSRIDPQEILETLVLRLAIQFDLASR